MLEQIDKLISNFFPFQFENLMEDVSIYMFTIVGKI